MLDLQTKYLTNTREGNDTKCTLVIARRELTKELITCFDLPLQVNMETGKESDG